ncbi:hypothetical protein DS745_03680 [Anaerobacillus alkaliphilus]|uniref:Uncharacterized protein n=1 Tax=Anaerobacillus alkaliphilus TaxID=1548597 RepID=A0A4Q0VXS4_9BACI|nr:hypothetical protein [Anaerobacillus alkaliphilus]RXJ04494.1 hypothetical protein DS745_03680 [Anaerobacillus alkaliphilus]
MKNVAFVLLLIILSGCKGESELPDTSSPGMTTSGMNFIAASDEVFYEDFKKLFDDQRSEDFIREKYELIKRTKTDGAFISTLTLVRYENNKALLVQLRHDRDKDEYLIYNIIEVPEEVAAFFEEEIE